MIMVITESLRAFLMTGTGLHGGCARRATMITKQRSSTAITAMLTTMATM